MLSDGTTVGLMVIVMTLDVAVVGDAQLALEVIIHFTVDPFVSVFVVKVALFVPAFVPLTCH
jgi:hypothetical protein